VGYFRFHKSLNIIPGLRLNLGRKSMSVSVGRRGAWLTAGTRGTRATVGLPGTGLSYTTTLSKPHHATHASDGAEPIVDEGAQSPSNAGIGPIGMIALVALGILIGFVVLAAMR
jgi:hypothetical protein